MNLIIVSGFLGAGKTTLLLAIAKRFSERGKRLAIIENEVGKVGVDDVRLRAEGLKVKEIYSGCICCSLRMDLIAALLEIERDYEPDVVILEPSGVAGPKQVIGALVGYGGEIDRKIMLSVVDASRFDKIRDMSIPLVTDGIEVADLVVINKCELVSADELTHIQSRIHEFRSDAQVIAVSAANDDGLDDMFRTISAGDVSVKRSTETVAKKGGPQPIVCTHEASLSMCDSVDAFRRSLIESIEAIVTELRESGCTLIGHVKAIAKSDGGGYLAISKTAFDHPAQTRGRLPKSARSVTITVNAIVYGVTADDLASIVTCQISRLDGVR